MSIAIRVSTAIAGVRESLRAAAMMYAVGGPVGMYHTLKLAYIKRRIRYLSECVTREKELHADMLRTLNFEITQLVDQQQDTSVAAAQFWNWCEKKAGVR